MKFEANIIFNVWRYNTTRCVVLGPPFKSIKEAKGSKIGARAQYPSTATCNDTTTCTIHDKFEKN